MKRCFLRRALLGCCAVLWLGAAAARAQAPARPYYEIGQPALTDLWVDPVSGDDGRTGASEAQALRTVDEAWRRIPMGTPLATGYRILLRPGTYPAASLPVYLEARHGSAEHPILIVAAGGPGTALIAGGGLNVFDTHYFYLIDLDFVHDPSGEGGGDVLHFERCSYVLIRRTRVDGGPRRAHETLKVNQSHHVYVEQSDLHGAEDNTVDLVAVQHGHFLDNVIHDAQDWCMYVKGGSAYFLVDGNTFHTCGTGGFTAGQGTGFQFMESPWLHYEAYDVRATNNVVHDTEGAGMGVQGGYNVLLAFNTLYRVGERSHVLEVGYGARSCDGRPGDEGRERCASYLAAGGWGTTVVDDGSNYVRIPNRNVFIYNNVVYNPPGYQSTWQHFAVPGPYHDNAHDSNTPHPLVADDNLRIRGNVIWNGPADHALGVGDGEEAGCPSFNPTCNPEQLRTQNWINTVEPRLADPAAGDFHPAPGNAWEGAAAVPVPDFNWTEAPTRPAPPPGQASNAVAYDRDGATRATGGLPGAYATGGQHVGRETPGGAGGRLALEQNHPNPARAQTVLRFTLDRPAHVTLRVFDVLGRVVATPLDGLLPSGPHEVRLDTGRLGSGCYVYTLSDGAAVVSKRMLVLQ